jgi:hypothetical protein
LKEIQSELISKAKEVAGSTERIADFCSNEGST